MTLVTSKVLKDSIQVDRIIGEHKGDKPGVNVVFIGGIHGNEPSGVFAINSVLEKLKELKPSFFGNFYGISGNLAALEAGVRFIDYDLNRVWKENINGYSDQINGQEINEKIDLIETLGYILEVNENRTLIFDLHTTSSQSIPFIVLGETIRNREIAKAIPAPMVLGLEEKTDGTLFNFLSQLGLITLTFESGQHDDLTSIKLHEAFIWLILEKLKCIDPSELKGFLNYKNSIKKATYGMCNLYEVRHRYAIKKDMKFSMNPGYINFQRIIYGERLGKNNGQDIEAKENGRIFMPLYQKQGEEGFFIIARIKKVWLKISEISRKLKIDAYMHWLPGVSKHPEMKNTFVINLKIARLFALQIFHLLGYRKETLKNKILMVSKREFDINEPTHQEILTRFLALKS